MLKCMSFYSKLVSFNFSLIKLREYIDILFQLCVNKIILSVNFISEDYQA